MGFWVVSHDEEDEKARKSARNGETASRPAVNMHTAHFLADMNRANGKQGHGIWAEIANNRADVLGGKNASIIGNNNAKNGADRLIIDANGATVSLQSKYCASPNACIDSCIQNGTFRYSGQVIEVPKDMYEGAVSRLERKINQGKVRGVNDPKLARKMVTAGHYTYSQAKNLARFGTFERYAHSYQYIGLNFFNEVSNLMSSKV